MLIAMEKYVPGFIVCEGDVLAATLIAVDLQDDEPMVTLADLGGAVLPFMSDIFYTNKEAAQRDAEKDAASGDVCDACIERAKSFELRDRAGTQRGSIQ